MILGAGANRLVATAMGVLVLAAACGGDDPTTTSSEPESAASAPADESTDPPVATATATAGGGHEATLTIGDDTFELTSNRGDDVCEGFIEEQLFLATWEDGPLSLFVNIDGDEGTIQLSDDVGQNPTFTWVADNGRTPLINAENTSTIDTVDFTDTTATGTASFIDVVEATQGPTETVAGTFEVTCVA